MRTTHWMFSIVLLCGFVVGCTDAEWDRTLNYGETNKVTLYSGGKPVAIYHTTGKIQSEPHSDGYYFRSKETGRLVTVSGDVVIEEQ